jgi:phosphonopyruvate decarboxylase
MLLFIGWRGEPGKRDEPQHSTQGQSTPGLLGMVFEQRKISLKT